ncbi:tyrosine decarboxylase 1-like protein, partial [Tanacetum coccineum]
MNSLEPKEFGRLGHIVIDFHADYYQNIEKYPVRSQVNPVATELEIVVMEWLSKLLQLLKSFSFSSDSSGGVLHSTTCKAFVCTLLVAKEKILDQIGRDSAEKLVVYYSDQTHFSFQKSVKISPDEMIKRDVEVGLVPMYLCVTVGTTSTTTVDPLGPLSE